ncbi:TlpA family protein disulfide reductase [Blastopirellula marina]|uniref:Thioredoxin domain-containing protein n=1 Tax=Blastopirellula marina TaxID=124 RepID=A0A2S8F4W1_9BACT|nr:TlpA disulfide reductase family protein [Blastopirellula marina]PQO27170.1 hypothetical protein C5Y98_28410 [Blastopirellula marina]PTL41317.1 TlpA family protein disulfide reductase [Blastopirellula marina]
MKFAWQIGLAAFLTVGFVGNINQAWAQEAARATEEKAEEKPAATEEKTEKEFAPASVEEGTKELLALLRDRSPDALPVKQRYAKGVAMINKMWDMERSPAETSQLTNYKMQLLTMLNRLGDEDAEEQLNSFIAETKKGILSSAPSADSAAMASQLASTLSFSLKPEEAATVINELADHFKDSGNEEVEKAAASLIGMARRFNLPGNPIELTGTKLNGEELNFPAAFKGKTVVIDFWATWCGPCIAEFPNMKKLYKAYHEHGFEIVGISLDDTKPVVETFVEEREIPWTIVWNDKGGERGWSDVNSVRYGITGIPTMIFVGKDGNVVSISARGKELDELLAEAYPDVKVEEEKPEEEAKTEETGE